jgi:hypothetical protein
MDIQFHTFAEMTGSNNATVDHSHVLFRKLPFYLDVFVVVDLRLNDCIRTFVYIKNTILIEGSVGSMKQTFCMSLPLPARLKILKICCRSAKMNKDGVGQFAGIAEIDKPARFNTSAKSRRRGIVPF